MKPGKERKKERKKQEDPPHPPLKFPGITPGPASTHGLPDSGWQSRKSAVLRNLFLHIFRILPFSLSPRRPSSPAYEAYMRGENLPPPSELQAWVRVVVAGLWGTMWVAEIVWILSKTCVDQNVEKASDYTEDCYFVLYEEN